MNILVLGGTQFVGRHIVEILLQAGHSISILNRGQSRDDLPNEVERLRGDRNHGAAGLDVLTDRAWDVCVDVTGYTARHVRSSAEKLRRNVDRYVFVSAVSVYGDPESGPVGESHPRLPPAAQHVNEVTGETYGPLKVTCENIVQDIFDGRCTLLRPQIIAGAFDPFDRFSYWVRRATQGGEMLAPGDGSDCLQYIDATDLAQFTRTACENRLNGCFNLSGSRITWTDFMVALAAQNIVWVPKEIIAATGVTEFELPLYRPAGGPRSSLMHVRNERTIEAGLTLTNPAFTIQKVRTWLRDADHSPALSSERENALIRMSRSPRMRLTSPKGGKDNPTDLPGVVKGLT